MTETKLEVFNEVLRHYYHTSELFGALSDTPALTPRDVREYSTRYEKATSVNRNCKYCLNRTFWGPEMDGDVPLTIEIYPEGILYVQHMVQDEAVEVNINYCPVCGRKLR